MNPSSCFKRQDLCANPKLSPFLAGCGQAREWQQGLQPCFSFYHWMDGAWMRVVGWQQEGDGQWRRGQSESIEGQAWCTLIAATGGWTEELQLFWLQLFRILGIKCHKMASTIANPASACLVNITGFPGAAVPILSLPIVLTSILSALVNVSFSGAHLVPFPTYFLALLQDHQSLPKFKHQKHHL